MDRNAAFDIVKEDRPELSKANRSTKIIDKKSVIQDVRSAFQDMMMIGWDFGRDSIVQLLMRVKNDSDGSEDFAVDVEVKRSTNLQKASRC